MINDLTKIYNKLPIEARKAITKDEFIYLSYKTLKGSGKAYAYLNAIYKMIAQHMGMRLKEVKDMLKFNCHLLHEIDNVELIMYSCADINKSTLNKYINWIIVFMSEQGCILPTPEQYKNNTIKYDKEISKTDIYY